MPRSVKPETVADRLNSAAIHLLRQAARVDVEAGIGPAQLSALSVLVFGGSTTLSGLADAEQVTLPTMSRVVSALAAAGLVRKQPSGRDRRSVLVSATPAGRRLMQAARRRRIEALAERLEALPQRDLAALERAAELMERVARGAGRRTRR
jgi:DNA-binding MarR family transcriptional regulator